MTVPAPFHQETQLTPDQPTTGALERRALILEYATIAWNVGEAVLTISLGSLAGSLALISFGTVSVVEVFASSVVVWSFRSKDTDHVGRSRKALKLIAVAFGLLALALAVAAINDLARGRRAGESPWGIAYLALTALVMFSLAGLKRSIATELGSGPLMSEATVTFLDGVLSATTLAGLALNAYAGWWWADPLAALLVALAAVNETRETWEEANEIEEGAGLV
jgi:divalent metal cation (Fe/Co/Zn/Cd) transporter